MSASDFLRLEKTEDTWVIWVFGDSEGALLRRFRKEDAALAYYRGLCKLVQDVGDATRAEIRSALGIKEE